MKLDSNCPCKKLTPVQWVLIAMAMGLALSLTGCSPPLTPELIDALAKDSASFCGRAGIRGGAGAMPIGVAPTVPVGGYGSSEVEFCRSNYPGASVSMTPSGPITITHGVADQPGQNAGGPSAVKR